MKWLCALGLACSMMVLVGLGQAALAQDAVSGWVNWRGPEQTGVAQNADLPDELSMDGGNLAWTMDLPGRGTVVVGKYKDAPRAIVWGYEGEGALMREVLACVDPATGKVHWKHYFADFISDIIYSRYSIGAATIDPETGNVYLMTTPGVVLCFDKDGKQLWDVSTMETYGRLTFPNGRTGAPVVDGQLVIVNAITSNWGSEGPARNRFYAFHKKTGDLVWSSDPGVGPPFLKDSSFSTPFLEWRDGKRIFYAGLGDGNVVGVNANSGEPIWRYQMAIGGVNSSPVVHEDKLIVIHGRENVNDTGRGFMMAIDLTKAMAAKPEEPGKSAVLGEDAVLWRNDELSMFTSSPTLVGDRVYQTTIDGNLFCVDANTGETIWKIQLGTSQLHASPLYADGKLYVPMWQDGLYVVKCTGEEPEVIQHLKLPGGCIGSPSTFGGRLYVHTTEKLFCWSNGKSDSSVAAIGHLHEKHRPGKAQSIVAVPNEFVLRPGEEQNFKLYGADANGIFAPLMTRDMPRWSPFIPPTAKVKAKLNASSHGYHLHAAEEKEPSAGAFEVTQGGISGTVRGRVLPSPPYSEDFDGFELTAGEADKFAYPPLPWIGARMKWEVREVEDGTGSKSKALAKTLDRVLFQRSMVFIGHGDDSNYTIQADVMTDGNRRIMSSGGVVNQRYIILLDGNKQQLVVTSNYDRVNQFVRFAWQPKTWYTIRARVDANDDGSGVVRAKAWKRDEAEPDAWTIEAEVPFVHTKGSPGLYGFSPQSKFRMYLDNIEVTPN